MPIYDVEFTVRHTVDTLVDADILITKLEEAAPVGAVMSAVIDKKDYSTKFYPKYDSPTIDQLFKSNLPKDFNAKN